MKRVALLSTLLLAGFAAACSSGGGGGTLPPPTPLGFSKSSLKGQYAFLMAGQAADGSFLTRIGTFVADGNGNIQGGTELVDTFSNNFQQLTFSSGTTYNVSSDGRGAMTLLNSSGPTAYSITFTSPTSGYICETDGVNGASGSFELQDTSAFTAAAVTGPFVFKTSGLDGATPNPNPDSIAGQIVLNSGPVSGGVYDENDANSFSGPVAITSGTFSVSDTTNGLGTLTFNSTFQYAFVIVNSKKFHLMEIPKQGLPVPITIGTAEAQTAPPATNAAFNSSFVLQTSGVTVTGPDFKVARFTADGTGGLTAVALDEKLLQNLTQVPNGTMSALTYSIDTNFPSSGRGTATFTDSNKGTYSFVFYMSSATQGVIQDVSKGAVGDGTIQAQSGAPFSNASIAADYAFNWSGSGQNNTTGLVAEEDFVGHLKLTSAMSSNVTGAMDFSELNLVDPAKVGIHDSVLTGAAAINGDGTTSTGNRSGLQVNATNPTGGPSTTFKFSLYPVNATTMFVISQDNDHSTGGVLTKQITPP